MSDFLATFPLSAPFVEFGFMRRALAGCLALSLGATPVGVFLMLRRMSLAGDAMSHAILPGAAIGYLLAGLSLPAMTLGGLLAGLAVAALAGGVARHTVIQEDTSLATFYLLSLSAGVLIISLRGSSIDLLHVLFGSVLALDDATLWLLAGFASLSVVALALGLRLFALEGCDPAFLARISPLAPLAHYGFLTLLVVNLVAGFHALGTLMAVGILILPAAAARLWVGNLGPLLLLAVLIALVGSWAGLLISYYVNLPAGPAIVVTLGTWYLLSLLIGRLGPLANRRQPTCRLWALASLPLILGPAFSGEAAAEPLPVVASFSILGDLTQRIGSERVRVHTLVGYGADAHVYQPTPEDAKLLGRASLVIVNGLGFEGWIERLVRSSGYRGRLLVAAQGIEPLRTARSAAAAHTAHEHNAAGVDPHAWQDPANVRRYVERIAAALSEADPTGAAVYRSNAARLDQEIKALDDELRAVFAALPAERRKVVSSHEAFAYFGRAYGIRFIAPVGLSTDTEPSAADVAAIIRQIRREKVRAMFIENMTDARLLQRIGRESGARIGGTLYADALSAPGGPADSYLGLMRHNARTLAAALAD